MSSSKSPILRRFPIDDFIVRIALVAPEEFLLPGNAHNVVTAMIEHLGEIKKEVKEAGVWFLTNEQKASFIGDYSLSTPLKYVSLNECRLTRLSLLQIAFSITFGTPFGLLDQRDGALVQDIFPKREQIKRVNSSFGSKENFVFHTDQAYNVNLFEVPRIVTLSCIRNEEKAITRVIHLLEILPKLSFSEIEILKQSFFKFYTGRPHENLALRIGPVLSEIEGMYMIRVATDMAPLNKDAQLALKSLREIMEITARNVILDSGDILVLPNWFSVHSRVPFIPSQLENKRRWLQRIFVK